MQIFAPAAVPSATRSETFNRVSTSGAVCLIALSLLTILLLRTAWVAEDAYIPFRVIDNFLHGYGLRWNVDDRVQSYTDPLFLFIVTFFTWLSGNVYLSVILVSLVMTVAAFLLITRGAGEIGVITAAVALIFSKAFVDFSVSGLENPATQLAIATYLYFYWRRRDPFILTLIAALAATNRQDTVLFFLPSLGLVYFRAGRRVWKRALLGWTPFLAWLLFSLFYYGFLFPNTAYAKLNTGIPTRDLIFQGILYYVNALRFDTCTLFIICLGLAIAYRAREWALAAGVILNLIYIVRVGGDFMSARFFGASLFFSVALIARYWRPDWGVGAATVAVIAALGLWVPYPTITSANWDVTAHPLDDAGIADERSYYSVCSGLMHYKRDLLWPICGFSVLAERAKAAGVKTVVMLNIGYYGYTIGPKFHVIDPGALADAFLARLPIPMGRWRVGHYVRQLPAGYEETVDTGVNTIADPKLHEYYNHLHTVISGNLWSWNRFKEIFLFNIGYYDHLVPHTRT
ncbi:hypothetical protein [Nevskia soli]|uniref:hypothetical protein n=1 Tax=Nevskia soli TaxID=418856 RepID=UPI0015D74B8E|nr:hypothetical protein [Nevskia soli]